MFAIGKRACRLRDGFTLKHDKSRRYPKKVPGPAVELQPGKICELKNLNAADFVGDECVCAFHTRAEAEEFLGIKPKKAPPAAKKAPAPKA